MKSLKTKIITIILLCTLSTSLFIGIASIINITINSTKDANKILSLTCEKQRLELDSVISQIELSVNTLANVAENNVTDISAFQSSSTFVDAYTNTLKDIALQFAQNTNGVLNVYIRYNIDFTSPTSGLFLCKNNTNNEFIEKTPTNLSAFESSDSKQVGWYYIPMRNKCATWLDPYYNSNINKYIISYVVPYYKNGVPIGIVGMDIDFDTLQALINKTKLYNTGYSFLTTSNNTIISKDALENTATINSLITTLLDNKESCPKLVSYNINNIKTCILYTVLKNGMKLVLTVPEKEINTTTHKLQGIINITILIGIVLSFTIGLILSLYIVKPIKILTSIINATSTFNLISTQNSSKLYKQKDETGTMACCIHKMRNALRNIISIINNSCNTISQNTNNLFATIININTMCIDNSTTTQQLATAMQETSATTECITEHMKIITTSTAHISELSSYGSLLSKEVLQRADSLFNKTTTTKNKTIAIYTEIKDNTSLAMEKIKSVDKINNLTDTITNISSQTSLLALNASIEAAHAGESGKGFAVVASEISTLAHQTSDAVTHINLIITEIHEAVNDMSNCIKEVNSFLENTVLTDYNEFIEVSEQYANDAHSFEISMKNIYTAINSLSNATTQIDESIQGINSTVTESTKGILDIAQKTTDIVQATSNSKSLAETNQKSISELENIVGCFKLN